MTPTELPKTYDPAAVEATAYQTWLDEGCFTADPDAPGEPYCIVIPPPNVTGALHLGHAINNTIQDILIRKARMEGKNALWIPGIDHAGIATQAVVEKQLKEKENKTRHDVGREGLVERIWAWKEQYGDRIIGQLKRLGCSCDWTRQHFTLDETCARAVRETFFKLFKDGLVYRGKRLVNWDTHLLTSISDDELYTETVKTSMWHIKYEIVGSEQSTVGGEKTSSLPTHMTVATTRPETMLADTAVAVHPDDPRWNWAIGKSVKLPLTGRLIPIIGDAILVDMTFGSGVVKVTPAHDPNDDAVYTRHKGTPTEIAILNLMTPDGKVNDADGSWSAYTGMTFNAARKQVVEDLIAGGFMTESDIKPHEANVHFSDRSKTAIQPYLSDQWFVKMAPLAEPALEVVRDETIKFYPERHAQQYLSWLGEKRDWPISRQLWWGHRIPVWKKITKDGDLVNEDSEVVMREFAPADREQAAIQYFQGMTLICVKNSESMKLFIEAIEKKGYQQDPDVLDTWFSSALWPHSTLGWPERDPSTSSGWTKDLAKWYPTTVLLTGRDIITLWVARMVMMGLYNMTAIPFAHVAINPTILDGKGERMSKSKGNGVDPIEIIDGYGADALRFTLTTMATETQDVRMPVKKDSAGRNTSEKFDFGRNFANKLWNAARFVLATLQGGLESPSTPAAQDLENVANLWIVSRFNRTLVEADNALKMYRFDLYAKACYDFFWRDFCDWYLEATKILLRDAATKKQTMQTLSAVLDGTLRLMHPVIPFITETIFEQLNAVCPERGLPGRLECPPSPRLIRAAWPTAGPVDEPAEHVFSRLQEIIGAIRNVRSEHKADPKRKVAVSISTVGDDEAGATNANHELIEALSLCVVKSVGTQLPAPTDAIRVTVNAVCEIYVEGLIDADAEKQRTDKRAEELSKLIKTLEGRMANESYMSKAPPALVKQTLDQLAQAKEELAKLG